MSSGGRSTRSGSPYDSDTSGFSSEGSEAALIDMMVSLEYYILGLIPLTWSDWNTSVKQTIKIQYTVNTKNQRSHTDRVQKGTLYPSTTVPTSSTAPAKTTTAERETIKIVHALPNLFFFQNQLNPTADLRSHQLLSIRPTPFPSNSSTSKLCSFNNKRNWNNKTKFMYYLIYDFRTNWN